MKPILIFTVSTFVGLTGIANDRAADNKSAHARQEAFTFYSAFPDKGFAQVVAQALGKKASDVVTAEQLAGFTGSIDASFPPRWDSEEGGEIHDLTGVGYLKGITELGVHKNGVTTLPPEIKELKNLKVLDLIKAFELSTLPPEIGQLPKLQKLQ